MLVARAGLGFQFPVPWPDETQFISPAYQLIHAGTLFDPGLNPDRIVMAMPPGYSVLLAAVFEVFGYSYSLARWLSTVCMLAALLVARQIVLQATSGRKRLFGAWIVGIAFASPSVLASSNFSRMEALVCCLVLAALLAGLAGRFYVMGSLVVLTATVHFNAIYFVPAVAADFGLRAATGRLRWPGRGGWLAIAAAAAAIGAYCLFIAFNWAGFVADMRLQFVIKAFFGSDDRAHPAFLLWAALALAALSATLSRLQPRTMLLALFGAGFVAMAHWGHELWYDYGQPVGFALLSLSALDALGITSTSGGRVIFVVGRATLAAAFAMTIAMSLRVTKAQAPFMPKIAMLNRNFVPDSDIQAVRRFIATLHRGDAVDFGFTGMENFFLTDLDRVGARWTRLNHDMFVPLPFRRSDWRVSCDSSDLSRPILQFEMTIQRKGEDTGCTILPGYDPNHP